MPTKRIVLLFILVCIFSVFIFTWTMSLYINVNTVVLSVKM